MIAIKTWVIHFNTQLWLINIIKKTTFSSIAIGLKNFYLPGPAKGWNRS